jgi:hypothetical protein
MASSKGSFYFSVLIDGRMKSSNGSAALRCFVCMGALKWRMSDRAEAR